MQESKLIFKPIKINNEEKVYQFVYNLDQLTFKFTFKIQSKYSNELEMIDKMKKNENYTFWQQLANGELVISAEDGITLFSMSNYEGIESDYIADGAIEFSLKNELCIDAIEEWLRNWKTHSNI